MGAPGTAVAGRLDVRADRLQVPARRPEQAAGRPAVEIAHLRKTYGQLTAVDDVSFSVTEGEIFGLLGPNGAGKTTTVECAIGLRSPDSGTIRLLGLDPQADWDEVHEIVGAQLQASTFPSKRADRGARPGGQAQRLLQVPLRRPAAAAVGRAGADRPAEGRGAR
jgi:translation initiation factor RLI1